MSKVFVLDTNKQPLALVHPGRARKLLSSGKAAVFRMYPFTIILKRAVQARATPPLRLKIDPGSKTTGMAIVNDATGEVVFAAELTHRGHAIKESLDTRRALRRSRRQRHTRYRKPRFDNRRRPQGWLPPSLESRLANTLTWTRRLIRLCPISAISQELVKFDLCDPFPRNCAYTGDEEEGRKPLQLDIRCWVRREIANSQPFVNEEMLLPQGSD